MDKIIIHCSDTPNGRHHTAEDIHRWHLERGWSGVGYHYIIRTDGVIDNGRPEYWKGSHAYGNNSNSIGICLIGRDDFTDEQMNSLYEKVGELIVKYPEAKVIGHNEVSNKSCPNFDVQEWLSNVFVNGGSL